MSEGSIPERPYPLSDDAPHIEAIDGSRIPIARGCCIGRGRANDVVIADANVSRKHAVIHPQNAGEFWLIDMGSSNGTFLNGRKLRQPTRVNDRDEIRIVEQTFMFRCPDHHVEHCRTTVAELTMRKVENTACWLLLADIENFTPLSENLMGEDLTVLLGGWINACKDAVERNGGAINKYLGDGLLAYWKLDTTGAPRVAAALSELHSLQGKRAPDFRVVLHFGLVCLGGVPSMGEESVIGREVNLLFRLEKLAASLRSNLAMSAPAAEALGALIVSRSLGRHYVKGFEHPVELLAID